MTPGRRDWLLLGCGVLALVLFVFAIPGFDLKVLNPPKPCGADTRYHELCYFEPRSSGGGGSLDGGGGSLDGGGGSLDNGGGSLVP